MKVVTINLSHVNTNCYLVIDEKSRDALVIDPGEYNQKLVDTIEKENVNIKLIVLTHGHFDHILGVYDLQKQTGASVAIHGRDAVCLRDEKESLMNEIGPGIQKPCVADRILADGDTVNVGEIELKVMYTPGHTKGSICLICEDERVIFSGDTLFCRTYGRTDLPGGNYDEMMLSLHRLNNLLGDYVIYPGHGISTTLDKERVWNRRLRKM